MMKFAGLLVCCVAVGVLDTAAQTEKGSWEISAAANMGSMSSSYESSGAGYSSSGSSDAIMYFALDLRTGWYLVDGFSLEPEVYMLAVDEDAPAFSLGANLAYTFNVRESPVKPFLIAGYGIGNAAPIMQRLLGRASDKLDIPVFRVGGGLKVFVSKSVALKVEYRYEQYTRESTSNFYYNSYTSTVTTNYHNLLFGFCVFFPAGG